MIKKICELFRQVVVKLGKVIEPCIFERLFTIDGCNLHCSHLVRSCTYPEQRNRIDLSFCAGLQMILSILNLSTLNHKQDHYCYMHDTGHSDIMVAHN